MKKMITFLCLGLTGASLSISASALPETDNNFSGEALYAIQNSDAETGISLFRSKNYTAALPHLQRAAKAGNIQVLSYLGYMYEKGLGTTKNYTSAFNMYKRGADNGEAECIYRLGRLYANGLGVTANQVKAFTLFKQSADLNYAYAADRTSYCYRTGTGTDKNMPEAIRYAQKACELGYTAPCDWLGTLYFGGTDGVAQDYAKALYYWTRPNTDYLPSTRLLTALMLHTGRGTSQTIQSYPCAYKQRFHKNGIDGKTYIAEALTIVDQLVKEGYEDARQYQTEWKAEYDEMVVAANKVEAPKFTQEIARFVHAYDVPREMAYCGGRAQYRAVIRSNGKVDNIRTLVCSVAAKADFDQTFLSRLPRFIPGTKGGNPVDMEVTFWVDWVPERNLQMVQCEIYQERESQPYNQLFPNS